MRGSVQKEEQLHLSRSFERAMKWSKSEKNVKEENVVPQSGSRTILLVESLPWHT